MADAEGRDLERALTALREKDIVVPGEGTALAGERELAFKHVLIRDVAYAMLPKAVRARKHFEVGGFIEERAGDRTDEVVALLAEHYGARGGARRRGPSRGRRAASPSQRQGARASSRPRATRPPPSTRTARRSAHYQAARDLAADAGDRRAHRREAGRRRAAARPRRRGDRGVGGVPRAPPHGTRTSSASPTCTARSAPALAHKGERKAAIEHHQKGINLLKDGPPDLELVRLYEEAAWLYMQTGDNMLAIYASEKALRLAERLGETRAA